MMASGSVVPSGETTIRLLEREARVAAFEALADAARTGGGRIRRHRGKCRNRQDACSTRRARSPSRGCGCSPPAAASLRASLLTGSSRQLFEPLFASVSADLRAELLSGPAAHSTALRNLAASCFPGGARRGFLRAPARPLLARRQRCPRKAVKSGGVRIRGKRELLDSFVDVFHIPPVPATLPA